MEYNEAYKQAQDIIENKRTCTVDDINQSIEFVKTLIDKNPQAKVDLEALEKKREIYIKLFPPQPPVEFPQEPGHYLWYVLDLQYMDVGLVQIMYDKGEHLKQLEENPRKTFYLYTPLIDLPGFTPPKLTLYHQAPDHLPPMDENNRPIVDGWIPFDFRWVSHYNPYPYLRNNT